MTRWRIGMAALLALLVAAPLALPLVELLTHPAGWHAWRDAPRIGELAATSLRLAGGTVLLTVPLGVMLAVLLERSDLPGRRWLRGLTVATVFVPLPLF